MPDILCIANIRKRLRTSSRNSLYERTSVSLSPTIRASTHLYDAGQRVLSARISRMVSPHERLFQHRKKKASGLHTKGRRAEHLRVGLCALGSSFLHDPRIPHRTSRIRLGPCLLYTSDAA